MIRVEYDPALIALEQVAQSEKEGAGKAGSERSAMKRGKAESERTLEKLLPSRNCSCTALVRAKCLAGAACYLTLATVPSISQNRILE